MRLGKHWRENLKIKEYDKILSRLTGKKRLILGNHDIGKIKVLSRYFNVQKIYGTRHLNVNDFKCILSHIPLHPNSIRKFGINIHGHTHSSNVKKSSETDFNSTSNPTPKPLKRDERYFNTSVEAIDYKPVNLDEIREYYKNIT